MQLSIIMPVYNEGEIIGKTIKRVEKSVRISHELLIVYDMDEDTTVLSVKKLKTKSSNIKLVKNIYGRGVLNAIKTGFEKAGGKAICVMMADLTDDPRVLDSMMTKFKQGYDVIGASRYMKGGRQVGGPLFKKILSKAAGISLHYLVGLPTRDATNSFRLYSKKFLKENRIESDGGFELAIELTTKAHFGGYKVTEVPTIWTYYPKESRFYLKKWLPKYLRWYFWAIGKSLSGFSKKATRRRKFLILNKKDFMNSNLLRKLKKLDVVVASHIFATGPALELEEYLKDKVKTLFFIGHPFSYRKETNSFYRFYKKGKLQKEYKAIDWKLPMPFFYFRDAFYTLWWTMSGKHKFDLFVGSDNLLSFLGLILRKIGKVKKVILYTIDYMPQRFENPILNYLYHFFDKQCLKHCNIVWNVSDRIEKARREYKGIGRKGHARQIVVRLGIWYKRIPKLPFSKKRRFQIVFLGHLLEKQGLQLVIKALPKVIKEIPKARLVVIGTGPYEERLKGLARKLRVGRNVNFLGYVEDHKDVEKILSESMLAVAPYKPEKGSFTYYADPGKIKNYLAAGLPVVLTDIPKIAGEIEKKKCAMICKYNISNASKCIIRFLSNEEMIKNYSKNAKNYARLFDWNKIFGEALSISL